MVKNRCGVASLVIIMLLRFVVSANVGDNANAIFSIVGGEQTASVHPGE